MNIYTTKGSKVIFAHPSYGWPSDVTKAAKHLTLNNIYTVDRTEVHSDYTDVYLVEHPGIRFNSVQFDNLPE